jgi:hypothetical protein
MVQGDPALMTLARAIAAGDKTAALAVLATSPELATARLARGATRQAAKIYCLDPIGHYFYAGQTALHVAAAAHQYEIADKLIAIKREPGPSNHRTSGFGAAASTAWAGVYWLPALAV